MGWFGPKDCNCTCETLCEEHCPEGGILESFSFGLTVPDELILWSLPTFLNEVHKYVITGGSAATGTYIGTLVDNRTGVYDVCEYDLTPQVVVPVTYVRTKHSGNCESLSGAGTESFAGSTNLIGRLAYVLQYNGDTAKRGPLQQVSLTLTLANFASMVFIPNSPCVAELIERDSVTLGIPDCDPPSSFLSVPYACSVQ